MMKNTDNKGAFNYLWRQTLVVMILVSLSKMGAIVVDGIIVARAYGADASAAMGLVFPFGTLMSLIGGLIGMGCQPICSACYARGDAEKSGKAFVTAFYIAVSASLVITFAAYIFAEPVCALLGAEGSNAYLLPETAAYLRGVSIGAVAMALNLILPPIVQLYGGGKWVRRSIRISLLTDVVLDILSVILKLGCWGIGFATSLSNLATTVILLVYLVSGKVRMRLTPEYFDPALVAPILKQGMPEALKRFFRMIGDVFANYIVLLTATGAAMAGKTLGNMAINIFSTIGLGAASAMYLLSGTYMAMEDDEGLVLLGRKQILHLIITTVLTALCFVLTPAFTDLVLNADAETKRISVVCIRCMLLQMPVYVCFEMVTSYLQSIGMRKDANSLSFLGQTLLYLPLVALMGVCFGAEGVILSTPTALLIALVIFYIRLCLRLHRPATLRDIMHISDCVHGDKIDVLARGTVVDMEGAVRYSEDIRTALTDRGADEKTVFAVSLLVEEVCANVVEHGFSKASSKREGLTQRKKYAAIFAFIKDGSVILRIYDNCVLFNPYEKLKSMDADNKNPEIGIGLKLILSMADEADYSNMLGMNHMLMRIPLHPD